MQKYFNKNFYNISDSKKIIDNLMNNLDLSDKFQIVKIKKDWENIIGEKMFKFTYPEKIYKNILYVKCTHSGWINSLNFNKSNILKKINESLKINLDNIYFK